MDFISEIGHLASTLAFFGMLLVAVKWITKRLAPKKADSFFLKLHKPVGYLTAIAGITHMVCAVRTIAVTTVWFTYSVRCPSFRLFSQSALLAEKQVNGCSGIARFLLLR